MRYLESKTNMTSEPQCIIDSISKVKKQRNINSCKGECQLTHKGKSSRTTTGLISHHKSQESVELYIQALKVKNCQSKLLNPAKLSLKIDENNISRRK